MNRPNSSNQFSTSNNPSRSKSCSGKDFACRVNTQSSIFHARLESNFGEFFSKHIIKCHSFIYIVFHHNNPWEFLQYFCQTRNLFFWKHLSNWIVRGVKNEHFCFLIQSLLKSFVINIPFILFTANESISTSLFEIAFWLLMSWFEWDTNRFSTSNLNLSPIAVIGRIKEDNLISLINESNYRWEKSFNTPIDSNNLIFRIKFRKSLMEFGNRFHQVQRTKSSCVLVVS